MGCLAPSVSQKISLDTFREVPFYGSALNPINENHDLGGGVNHGRRFLETSLKLFWTQLYHSGWCDSHEKF